MAYTEMHGLVFEFHSNVTHRGKQQLRQVAVAVGEWSERAFSGPLPRDWRAQYRAVLADQAAARSPRHARQAQALEDWFEAFAQYCGLLPSGPVMEHHHRWLPQRRSIHCAARASRRPPDRANPARRRVRDPRHANRQRAGGRHSRMRRSRRRYSLTASRWPARDQKQPSRFERKCNLSWKTSIRRWPAGGRAFASWESCGRTMPPGGSLLAVQLQELDGG